MKPRWTSCSALIAALIVLPAGADAAWLNVVEVVREVKYVLSGTTTTIRWEDLGAFNQRVDLPPDNEATQQSVITAGATFLAVAGIGGVQVSFTPEVDPFETFEFWSSLHLVLETSSQSASSKTTFIWSAALHDDPLFALWDTDTVLRIRGPGFDTRLNDPYPFLWTIETKDWSYSVEERGTAPNGTWIVDVWSYGRGFRTDELEGPIMRGGWEFHLIAQEVVPEPCMLLLIVSGVAGVAYRRRGSARS